MPIQMFVLTISGHDLLARVRRLTMLLVQRIAMKYLIHHIIYLWANTARDSKQNIAKYLGVCLPNDNISNELDRVDNAPSV